MLTKLLNFLFSRKDKQEATHMVVEKTFEVLINEKGRTMYRDRITKKFISFEEVKRRVGDYDAYTEGFSKA